MMEKNQYGLREKYLWRMQQLFSLNPEIEKVILFGSRAKGTQKDGSDVDLALVGSAINFDTMAHIKYVLNEAISLPYKVDVLHYDTNEHAGIKAEIDSFGKVIYDRATVRFVA
jgi:predicted nucleotidyltransferase